jgi:hypothetical protein
MPIHFSRKQLPKAGLAVAAAFAALTVWNLARIAMLARPSGHDAQTTTVLPPSVGDTPSSVQRILRSGWLSPPGHALPATSLPFTLKGTYAGSDGKGYAIIADAHGKSGVYAQGSELPGHARIKAVDAHRVLLTTSRGEEALPLHEPAGSHDSRSGMGSVQASAGSALPTGLTINAQTPRFLVHALRLRPGDIVSAINGQPVAGRSGVMDILRRQPPGATIKLRILRGGRSLTLDVRAPMPGMLDHMEP